MRSWTRYWVTGAIVLIAVCGLPLAAQVQDQTVVLAGADLSRVVPPGFYFQGLTAPTQMRN